MSALVEEGNKFKQVSSDGHQTLLAGGWGSGHVQGGAEVPCPEGGSQGWVGWGGGTLYSEFQCIMDNDHMGPP